MHKIKISKKIILYSLIFMMFVPLPLSYGYAQQHDLYKYIKNCRLDIGFVKSLGNYENQNIGNYTEYILLPPAKPLYMTIMKQKTKGYKITDHTYIKPRVSVSYLKQVIDDIKEFLGFYNSEIEEQLNEKFKIKDQSEGGLEIIIYF